MADDAGITFVTGTTESPEGLLAGLAPGAELLGTWPVPDDASHVVLLRVPAGAAEDAVDRLGLGARSFPDEASARRAAGGSAAALGALPAEGDGTAPGT